MVTRPLQTGGPAPETGVHIYFLLRRMTHPSPHHNGFDGMYHIYGISLLLLFDECQPKGSLISCNQEEPAQNMCCKFGHTRLRLGHKKKATHRRSRACLQSMPEVDRRLHFALNCGAKSCPPIKVFTVDVLEEGLASAAAAFVEGCFALSDPLVWIHQKVTQHDACQL